MSPDPEFEELVNLHYRPLYQFAFSLARDEADAADLTQQAFYVWATKGHQLRDRSKARTWLFTTLHREYLSSRRRQGRFTQMELEQAEAELPVVEAPSPAGLDGARVIEALAQLDEVFRAPVALFYLQDMAYKDIADVLAVPIGTVKSRLSRGLAQLQQLLSPRPAETLTLGGRHE